jgi:hypothetical protein
MTAQLKINILPYPPEIMLLIGQYLNIHLPKLLSEIEMK